MLTQLPLSLSLLESFPILEIGCGNGDFLVNEAKEFPYSNFIGCDIKPSRIQKSLSKIEKNSLPNAFLFHGKGEELLEQFSSSSLGGIHINFPDPWWKKRYHKRRFFYIQEDVDMLVNKLSPGAFISFISDHKEYFDHVLSLLSYNSNIIPEWEKNFKQMKETPIQTVFSKKWEKENRVFFQTLFKKREN